MIKLIAIDVDGTLLDGRGRIPDDNLTALEEAAARGIQLVIVTGRSFHFAMPAVAALPDPLTLIVYNGAIARTRTGDTIIRRLLPRRHALDVLASTVEWRASAIVLFDRPFERQLLYDRMDWSHPNRSGFRERNRAIIQEVPSLDEAISEDPIQVAFNGGVGEMRTLVAQLAAHPSAGELAISLTEYPQRDFSLVDVCSAGTTKGATLAQLAGSRGIDRAEVLAVGDNFNDRDMLEWAGHGVVMGNACEELRTCGLKTTGTNDEAGLAQAIRSIALG